MILHTKRLTVAILLCGLLSVLLACSWLDNVTGNNNTATPTASTSSKFTTYSGDGYQVNYPSDWKIQSGGDGTVTFSDPAGIAYLLVRTTPNPGGAISPTQQLDLGMQLFKSQAKNVQEVSIDPKTTVAGENWEQKSATGDVTPSGQSTTVTAKAVVIATNHPANATNTKSYVIAYVTEQRLFDLANTSYFQPMLQSFAFK